MRSPLHKRGSRVVFTLHDNATGEQVGSYDRSCGDRYEWSSEADARRDNCHDIFEDREKYKVKRWRVTYELLDDEEPSHA